ncbi:glycosyltransferase family 2 protein [Bacillus songklensis]|uniref:Glycosyltransferase family 2 protein n=1 Tax=Bacillus songklensis TaxID=1069116 RepID=A0ABV8B5T4_9BACI
MFDTKISVIVPVYNVEEYLCECLNSIQKQTYKNIEVLMINDGSSDNSGKICDDYAAKYENFKVIHKVNEGVSIARNTGLTKATGEYCIFIDSDDYLDKSMIEILVNKAITDNADIVMCGICLVNTNFHKAKRKFRYQNYLEKNSENLTDKEFINTLIKYPLEPYFGAPYNKLIRRKLLVDNSIFYEDHDNFAEDTCLNYKVFNIADKIATVEKVLYYHRVNAGNSLSRLKHSYQYMKTRCNVINNLYAELMLKYDGLVTNKNVLSELLFRYCVDSIISEKNVSVHTKVKNLKNIMDSVEDEKLKDISGSLFAKNIFRFKIASIYFSIYRCNTIIKYNLKKSIFKINKFCKLI